MKNKLIIILLVAVLLVVNIGTAGAKRSPINTSFDCPNGHTCHALMHTNSELYLRFNCGGEAEPILVKNDPISSWYIKCPEGENHD